MKNNNYKLIAALSDFSGKKEIKKCLPDIFFIVLIALFAFLAAEKPAIRASDVNLAADNAKMARPEIKKEGKAADAGRSAVPDEAIKSIKGRNIFVASGAYSEQMAQSLPENPYALIAVLKGKEKKAVFRDYLGNVLTLPVGGSLVDGFVVARIDEISVSLQKRNERKELRLFSLGGKAALPPSVAATSAAPTNLYILTGILAGREKKAVFKDNRGAVSILAKGAKLPDGFVIAGIDDSTVLLKKGSEKKELKIFGFSKQ